jgi:XRE family transcriptional regulator, regulator of sulfur utilization
MSSDICTRIGTRIRELRTAQGWTQFEMAERTGIDRSYLAEVETGKIEICIRNLDLIAQTFKIELHQLLKFPAKDRKV